MDVAGSIAKINGIFALLYVGASDSCTWIDSIHVVLHACHDGLLPAAGAVVRDGEIAFSHAEQASQLCKIALLMARKRVHHSSASAPSENMMSVVHQSPSSSSS